MKFLGYLNRFISNFAFLALAYYSLNLMEKYQQRVILAVLILVYAALHGVAAFRSFYFFHRIERLEKETRRLGVVAESGPSDTAARKIIVGEVAGLRRSGELNTYMDLMFLTLVTLLCFSKIVTD